MTMHIRMKVTSAGPEGVLNEGKVYDVDDVKGQMLLDGGYATLIAVSAPETAAAAPDVEEDASVSEADEEDEAEESVAVTNETATVSAPETAAAAPQRDGKPLSRMNRGELAAEAAQRGLGTGGAVAQLLERIKEHDAAR